VTLWKSFFIIDFKNQLKAIQIINWKTFLLNTQGKSYKIKKKKWDY